MKRISHIEYRFRKRLYRDGSKKMKEYLEIRIVGYNIFRILIVDSKGPLLPFRPITRLRWLEGARVRALLSSKEKIDRVENTIGGIFPKERKEFSGRQVVPATGSKQRPARRNIMDRMLLRGAEMKTAKWCTRLSNWNVSALDGIPRSFFFLFLLFSLPPSFSLPDHRTDSENVFIRNRSIS